MDIGHDFHEAALVLVVDLVLFIITFALSVSLHAVLSAYLSVHGLHPALWQPRPPPWANWCTMGQG